MFDSLRDAGTEFGLRTPSITDALGSLEATVSEGTRTDMEAILRSEASSRRLGEGIIITQLSILLAARDEALLYDVGDCAERSGTRSRATLSRTKTGLEDDGPVTTEKVSQPVGRPQPQLLLPDKLAEADSERVIEIVADLSD